MWYRDVAYLGVTGDRDGLLLKPLADRIAERSATLPSREAANMALRIPEHRALLENYVNPRMVLERLYMEIQRQHV